MLRRDPRSMWRGVFWSQKLDNVLIPVFAASIGLVTFAVVRRKRICPTKMTPISLMQVESTLTCPRCGHQSSEQMPIDACQYFHVCKGCGERLRPLPGDCCVCCSYGTVPCPPVQMGQFCAKPQSP